LYVCTIDCDKANKPWVTYIPALTERKKFSEPRAAIITKPGVSKNNDNIQQTHTHTNNFKQTKPKMQSITITGVEITTHHLSKCE
jgi:hypothetical protein